MQTLDWLGHVNKTKSQCSIENDEWEGVTLILIYRVVDS